MTTEKSPPETLASITARLEELLANLEGDALSLEDSIDAYEQSTKLLLAAQEKLNQAEQKVLLLSKEGTVKLEPSESDAFK